MIDALASRGVPRIRWTSEPAGRSRDRQLRDSALRRDGLASSPRILPGTSSHLEPGPDRQPLQVRLRERPRLRHDARAGKVRGPGRPRVCAYGFGWGVVWLTARSRQKVARVAPAALAIALPHAYTPNLFGASAARLRRARSRRPGRSLRDWSVATRCCCCHGTSTSRHHSPATERSRTRRRYYITGAVLTSEIPGRGYAFAAEDSEHVFIDRLLGPPVDRQRLRAALTSLGVRYIALAKVADWRQFASVADAPGIRLKYSSPSIDLYSVRPTAKEIRDDLRVRALDPVHYRVLPGHPGTVALPVPYSRDWAFDGHPATRLADGQAGVSSRPQEEVTCITVRPTAF